MSRPRYIVGIDLGTTNSVVAYVDTKGRERPAADVRAFEVPQLVAAGQVAPRPMLPSFLYLPGPHELPAGASAVPWDRDASTIVGEFARVQGGRVPGRLVSSAKSWLCHPGVDREADILPWGAAAGSKKVSPVEASAAYLRHIRDAWDHQFGRDDPGGALAAQEVVLTVPASFDEAARELTLDAARRAGLPAVTLLEEPQAAFYCWIVGHQDGWQREVRGGENILVFDVGGGTSDFSLITVVETPTGPGFRRVAVGDHLMLGGDNIDLALAHLVEAKLGGAALDAEQWMGLRLACRTAKEMLLDATNPAPRWPVTIAGRGSRLIGGSIQSELTREEVRSAVVDGFFPIVGRDDPPSRSGRGGLQEFGLPFVADPAVTRHLAAFLHRSGATGGMVRPDAILFNGGALTPPAVRDRVVEAVRNWSSGGPGEPPAPRVLTNASLDLAVAIGAAYYGVVRRGGGIRIGGGTARAVYVGFAAGGEDARRWLCVVPRDAQEGDRIEVAGRDLSLTVGQDVSFPMASSSVRAGDRPGDLVGSDPDSIKELPPLVGHMRVGRKAKAETVTVRLESRVTEVGTIEVWCHARDDDRRWRLQVQLRGPAGEVDRRGEVTGGAADAQVVEEAAIDAATAAIREAFGPGVVPEARGPSRLVKNLEAALELPRPQWPPSALRALWEPLKQSMDARSRSPQHESRWLNLAGYCLRPGVGFPLDESRIKALWPAFHAGTKHAKESQVWAEWWILWRRVAAGLNRSHHDEIHRRLLPFLLPPKGPASKKPTRPKPEPHELAEMWRCAAGLERLTADQKVTLGSALAADLTRPQIPPYALWCLGRFGARVPVYGPANGVVGPEVAARWIDAILARPASSPRDAADAAFALGQIARVSGDRARDLDDATRRRVADALVERGADDSLIAPVREFREVEAAQQGRSLGDDLPVGLRLLATDGDQAG